MKAFPFVKDMEEEDTNEGDYGAQNDSSETIATLSQDENCMDDLPDLSAATQQESSNALLINCSYCSRKFSRESSYKRHLQTHLQDPIKCEYCGRICPKKSVLIKHLRTHTGEKPYECEVCQLQFATKPSLDYHLAVHKGERPFVCDYCGKGFIQNSHLTRHLRVHTGEKPYCCTYCDMKFSRQGSLQVHLRRHTGEVLFTCTHCDRKFTNESTFKYHLKKLSGQKPFVCRFCGWSFISSSHLRKHEKVHLRNENFEDSKFKWIKKSLNHDSGIKQELPFQSCKESSNMSDSDSSNNNNNKLNVINNNNSSSSSSLGHDDPIKNDSSSIITQGNNTTTNNNTNKMRTTTRNYHCPYCPLKFIRRSALQSHLTFHEAQTQLGHQEFLYQSSTIKIKNENECLVIPVICDLGRMKNTDQNHHLGSKLVCNPIDSSNRASLEKSNQESLRPDWNNSSSDSDKSEPFSFASDHREMGSICPMLGDEGEGDTVISVLPHSAYLSELSDASSVHTEEESVHRIRTNNRKNPFPRKLVRRT